MQINRKIREDAGFPQSVRQPWARKPSGKSAGSLELRYYFTCEEFPDALFLVLEQPERYRITCNGKPLNSDADGWWVDPALQRLPIAKEVLNNGKMNFISQWIICLTNRELKPCFLSENLASFERNLMAEY